MRRALEVGIRKVMGALRGALIRQFIVESFVIATVALIISLLLLSLVVPMINQNLGTSLQMETLTSPGLLAIMIGVLVFTGLLSGSYPAFYLSRFRPIQALKGGSKRTGSTWVRKTLVTLQFAVSMFMLLSTFVIYQQMQYVRVADMGFNQDRVVQFVMGNADREKWPVLRNKLLQSPNITKTSTSTSVPGSGYDKNMIPVETNEGVMDDYGVDLYGIDYEYFNVLEVDIVEGRNISPDFPSDTASAVIVNEAMVARMGWDKAIGKRFQISRDSCLLYTSPSPRD